MDLASRRASPIHVAWRAICQFTVRESQIASGSRGSSSIRGEQVIRHKRGIGWRFPKDLGAPGMPDISKIASARKRSREACVIVIRAERPAVCGSNKMSAAGGVAAAASASAVWANWESERQECARMAGRKTFCGLTEKVFAAPRKGMQAKEGAGLLLRAFEGARNQFRKS